MASDTRAGAVLEYYDTHPINEQQIIDKMLSDGVDLSDLSEDILQNYDQDHYGGVAANDALANLAGISDTTLVLDVCCGLGGPSRYLAHKRGCRVVGIDLTESRIAGARRLTKMTGLDGLVSFEGSDALQMPFEDATFDVVISQEAFCHIPDKTRLIEQCARVVKAGGRIAFTDILATDQTTEGTRDRLKNEMAFQELGSATSYRGLLVDSGCLVEDFQDLSAAWRLMLVERLAMYRSLKDQTVERFGEDHFYRWDDAYSFFVDQYETGELGGGRFLATLDHHK